MKEYAIVITNINFQRKVLVCHVKGTLVNAKQKATEYYTNRWDYREREIYVFESNEFDDYYMRDAICCKSKATNYKWFSKP